MSLFFFDFIDLLADDISFIFLHSDCLSRAVKTKIVSLVERSIKLVSDEMMVFLMEFLRKSDKLLDMNGLLLLAKQKYFRLFVS